MTLSPNFSANAHLGTGEESGPACGGGPRWSTSSYGHSVDTSPMELNALGDHLQQCSAGNPRLQALQRGVQAVHGWVAPRFVSTLAVLVVVLGGLLMLF
jgi:hypothetical protein